jgi:hypothetical protein
VKLLLALDQPTLVGSRGRVYDTKLTLLVWHWLGPKAAPISAKRLIHKAIQIVPRISYQILFPSLIFWHRSGQFELPLRRTFAFQIIKMPQNVFAVPGTLPHPPHHPATELTKNQSSSFASANAWRPVSLYLSFSPFSSRLLVLNTMPLFARSLSARFGQALLAVSSFA